MALSNLAKYKPVNKQTTKMQNDVKQYKIKNTELQEEKKIL